MAQSTTTNLANAVKNYYEKVLLDRLEKKLFFGQFADKRPLPRNSGKTIEFTRYTNFAASTTALTEGTVPTAQTLSASKVTASISQYGGFVELTDLLLLTKIDPELKEQIALMGYQAGLSIDTVIRNALTASAASTTVLANSKAALSAVGPGDTLKGSELRNAARLLKKNDVMAMRGNDFICLAHPNNTADLMADTAASGWLEAHKYEQPENIFNGETGKLFQVRVIETTNIASTSTGTSASANVYDTYVFGLHGYAMTELNGMALKLIITPAGPNVADPLQQKNTVAWKIAFATVGLDANRVIRLRVGSSFAP